MWGQFLRGPILSRIHLSVFIQKHRSPLLSAPSFWIRQLFVDTTYCGSFEVSTFCTDCINFWSMQFCVGMNPFLIKVKTNFTILYDDETNLHPLDLNSFSHIWVRTYSLPQKVKSILSQISWSFSTYKVASLKEHLTRLKQIYLTDHCTLDNPSFGFPKTIRNCKHLDNCTSFYCEPPLFPCFAILEVAKLLVLIQNIFLSGLFAFLSGLFAFLIRIICRRVSCGIRWPCLPLLPPGHLDLDLNNMSTSYPLISSKHLLNIPPSFRVSMTTQPRELTFSRPTCQVGSNQKVKHRSDFDCCLPRGGRRFVVGVLRTGVLLWIVRPLHREHQLYPSRSLQPCWSSCSPAWAGNFNITLHKPCNI